MKTEVQLQKELIDMGTIQKLLDSLYVKDKIKLAAAALDNPEFKPKVMTDFTQLRDVLITKCLITCLRRSLEFSEFTIGEFNKRIQRTNDKGKQETVIKIVRHKTGYKCKCYKIIMHLDINDVHFATDISNFETL